jgi:hypothetical protein
LPKLEIIGYKAFEGCAQLIELSLPNLTSVGIDGFSDCVKIK